MKLSNCHNAQMQTFFFNGAANKDILQHKSNVVVKAEKAAVIITSKYQLQQYMTEHMMKALHTYP